MFHSAPQTFWLPGCLWLSVCERVALGLGTYLLPLRVQMDSQPASLSMQIYTRNKKTEHRVSLSSAMRAGEE